MKIEGKQNRTKSRLKQNLDHQVWKLIKEYSLQNKKILVALSGGIDSAALLCSLSKVHDLDLLTAAYFHHGDASNQDYRDQAAKFCQDLCSQFKINFVLLHAPNHEAHFTSLGPSEQQYRQWRYEALRRLQLEQSIDVLATGHHADDLLETRLIRLIRGTGAQGLQAMSVFKNQTFRPFLEVSKLELREYLRSNKVRWMQDPTNFMVDPLRNWIRERWLKALERRQKGTVMVLGRSLETLTQEIGLQPWGDLLRMNESALTSDLTAQLGSRGLSRSFFLTLSSVEQKRLLAQYLFSLGCRDFTQSQIEEIQKRLDNSQKVITFTIGGCQWCINAERIVVQF